MKLDVKTLALDLFTQGLIVSQPDVATGRKRFWANFGPKEPTQILVTDGATRQHPNPDPTRLGVMEYEVVDEPTYVLIVEHDEPNKAWVIIYAYFFKRRLLNTRRLKHELRMFKPANLSPERLEELLKNIPHHD